MPRANIHWVWRAAVAGLCGSAAHGLLMYSKTRLGLLPSFQPYLNFQITLSRWVGTDVPSVVPWVLSFLNGSVIIGFVFGRIYRWLPGRNGAVKGLIYGVFGWAVAGLVFFPLLGMGWFATGVELGLSPALFSLAMLLTYSVVMGIVYEALRR